MSETPDTTINLTKNYKLKKLDLAQLAEFFSQVVYPFMGADANFSGKHEWNDKVTRQKNFQSLEQWATAPAFPLETVTGGISTPDYRKSFDVTWYGTQPEIYLRARVPESEQENMLALFSAFESRLGLKESKNALARGVSDFRFEQTYLVTSKQEDGWLQKAVEAVGRLRPEREDRNLNLRLRSGLSRKCEDVQSLLQDFSANPSIVVELSLTFRFTDSDVHISCDLDREKFRVEVVSPSEQGAVSLMSEIDAAVGLHPIKGAVAQQGLTKGGFTKGKFDLNWFKESIRCLRSQFRRIQYFAGDVTLIKNDASPRKFTDVDAWLKAVGDNWGEIKESYLTMEGAHQTVRITFYHREESARLEVLALSEEEAEALLEEINKQFKIEFRDENPYAKAISSRIFAIRAWQDRTFAELVEEAVAVAIRDKHWILDGWIRQEGETSQPLLHAKSLEEYLKLLEGGKYVEADLRIAGPRGRVLRIRVYENRSRIEFRSSLQQTELDNVAEPFRKSLKLKTLKEIESGYSAAGPKEKEKPWYVKALPALGAAVLALVLSVAFIKALVPQDSVEIMNPRGGKEESKLVDGSDFRVEWRVQRERYFRKLDVASPHANIRLVGGKNATEYQDKASGDQVLNLAPGSYVLTVSIPSLQVSDTVYFSVKGPPEPEL